MALMTMKKIFHHKTFWAHRQEHQAYAPARTANALTSKYLFYFTLSTNILHFFRGVD